MQPGLKTTAQEMIQAGPGLRLEFDSGGEEQWAEIYSIPNMIRRLGKGKKWDKLL